MALPQGINFRGTAGYVTDGANEDNEASAGVTYPRTSAQGNTVGWEQAPGDHLDRNSALDRRLAGIHYRNGTSIKYRIDLPATGNYNVRCACGDAIAVAAAKLELFDTTTSLGVLASAAASGVASGSFRDATNTEYTAANWPGSNTAVAATFASTICRFALGGTANFDILAHVYIEAAAASGVTYPQLERGIRGLNRGVALGSY